MNIYTYKKSSSKSLQNASRIEDSLILPVNRRVNINLSYILTNSYENLKRLVQNSKLASLLIPSLLIFLGFVFIYKQFLPEIQQIIERDRGYFTQGNLSPVADSYVNFKTFISNPSGLSDLTKRALDENILTVDNTSLNYSGTFYISIPNLGINRMPVTANVDSTTENAYMGVLDSTLAHFKSTGLPISEVKNNIVVYGHSASPNYNPQREDPKVAFSFLPNIQVGDDVIIEMEGKEYRYKIHQSKIVEPNETSIITGTKGKRTLTLFTCFPLGSDAQRFVAVAREV